VSEPAATEKPAAVVAAPEGRAEQVAAWSYADCPHCVTGLLLVVGYDETAVHEQLQGHTAVPFTPSGGSVHRHCFLCDYHESIPLNPGGGDE